MPYFFNLKKSQNKTIAQILNITKDKNIALNHKFGRGIYYYFNLNLLHPFLTLPPLTFHPLFEDRLQGHQVI